jgi:hypothetical protein
MTTAPEVLARLARNAKVGDGHFWRHPECRNHKVIFTGTNRRWMEYKGRLANRPVKLQRKANSGLAGVYPNSKALWSVTTNVAPIFTEYAERRTLDVVKELDLVDMATWFLDDGCTIERRDHIRADGKMTYRHFLCIGSLCPTEDEAEEFLNIMRRMFCDTVDRTIGRVGKCGSRASVRNKVWNMPVAVGRVLCQTARVFGDVGFDNKLRHR